MSSPVENPELAARDDPSLPPLHDDEFKLFQELIRRETGIHLTDAKRSLLVGRLARRLRDLGLKSFFQYYRLVVDDDRAELMHMVDCVSTNETRFFREPQHFEFITTQVVPEWTERALRGNRERRVRVWSAGCSSGEEPYSLAMCLLEHCPPASGFSIEVLATDISTRVLERARRGLYPIERAKEIPEAYAKRFMLRGTRDNADLMKPGPEVRSVVRFARLNLNDETYPVAGTFDLILCRNVLIYFEPEARPLVVSRLLRHLASDGYLFVGHAETLAGVGTQARIVTSTVYAPIEQ